MPRTAPIRTAPIWRAVNGSPVSCVEKIKVLDQNLAEFRAFVADLLEDAALMGCDLPQVLEILKKELETTTLVGNQKSGVSSSER